jgi:hypothetical protein
MISVRLRTRTPRRELDQVAGMVLGEDAHNLLLTGPAQVLMPDGRPLCVYLPGWMAGHVTEEHYQILHGLRSQTTDNRGLAAGGRRMPRGDQKRTRTLNVASAILGAVDPTGTTRYCRLTSWTGQNLPGWQELHGPLLRVAEAMREYVPDRTAVQQAEIDATHPDWVVPGTPFTTVTVNNTYPTGVHTDKGDLAAGFSSIFAIRRGDWTGGRLVFPEWRVAADLADGDLILMDAHQWHGNTAITCRCGTRLARMCPACGAERVSVVAYMRAKLTGCASEAEETARAIRAREAGKGLERGQQPLSTE